MSRDCRVQALAVCAGLGTSTRDSMSPDGSSPGPPSTTHGSQEGDGPHHFLISPFALLVKLQTFHAHNSSPSGSHHQLGNVTQSFHQHLHGRHDMCGVTGTLGALSTYPVILQARAKDSLRRSGSISRPESEPVHLDKGYSHNVGPTTPYVLPHCQAI